MKKSIKICGITSADDAKMVCDAGVDAIGLMFYPKSPRNISLNQAEAIISVLYPFVKTVALFLDAEKQHIENVTQTLPIDLLQFHGTETPEYCASFKQPYIKTIGMKSTTNNIANINSSDRLIESMAQYRNAQGFLLDSHAIGEAGGTGQTFDWHTIPKNISRDINKPLILAGGITPGNISTALSIPGLYGIDLSSGVESSPGIKDPAKVDALMKEVYRV